MLTYAEKIAGSRASRAAAPAALLPRFIVLFPASSFRAMIVMLAIDLAEKAGELSQK